jgi:hypothetical protein
VELQIRTAVEEFGAEQWRKHTSGVKDVKDAEVFLDSLGIDPEITRTALEPSPIRVRST